jgi:hypothetical protein
MQTLFPHSHTATQPHCHTATLPAAPRGVPSSQETYFWRRRYPGQVDDRLGRSYHHATWEDVRITFPMQNGLGQLIPTATQLSAAGSPWIAIRYRKSLGNP